MPSSEVYNEDCMIGMARYPDKFFELAIVDPPYGRGESGGKNRSGWVRQPNGKSLFVNDPGYTKKHWDVPPKLDYFEELRRTSKQQIIWGWNYIGFGSDFGPGRIIWDKCNDGSHQCGAEIALNTLNERVDIFRYMWRGMLQGKSALHGSIQQGDKTLNEARIHPTQKPVALYKWLLAKFGNGGGYVLDTHLGSQSSRIASYDMGFDFIGLEIDQEYFTAGCSRFERHIAQQTLFNDPDLYTTGPEY